MIAEGFTGRDYDNWLQWKLQKKIQNQKGATQKAAPFILSQYKYFLVEFLFEACTLACAFPQEI